MSDNSHPMCTRSKKKGSPPDELDEQGNLKNLIDYSCDRPFDRQELDIELERLSRGSYGFSSKLKEHIQQKKKKSKIQVEELDTTKEKMKPIQIQCLKPGSPMKNKQNSQNDLGGLLINYILTKANEQIKKKPKRKKKKIIEIKLSESDSEDIEVTDDSGSEDFEDALTEKSTTTEESSDMILDDDSDITEESEESVIDELMNIDIDEEEEQETDEESEYDELDTAYSELVDEYSMDNTEDGNLDYFHTLTKETKIKYLKDIRKVYKTNSANVPLKFKVLNSDMDIYTKAIAINNLDKLAEMDISTGEYNKMDQWINGLIKLPFGKSVPLPVSDKDSFDKKRDYIKETLDNMNNAIYVHV